MNIPNIETAVLSNVCDRYQQQFGCDLVIDQTPDAVKQLQQRKSGGKLTYPFAYAKIGTMRSPQTDDYTSRHLLRNGVIFKTLDNMNSAQAIRLIPAHFDMDITYETNLLWGQPPSCRAYINRWLFAARGNFLNSTLVLGRVRLGVGVTMNLDVVMPERGNVTEEDSSYKIVTQCTVRGFVSEAISKQVGVINDLRVQAKMPDREGVTMWEFPEPGES